jgi:hypothetical protein
VQRQWRGSKMLKQGVGNSAHSSVEPVPLPKIHHFDDGSSTTKSSLNNLKFEFEIERTLKDYCYS